MLQVVDPHVHFWNLETHRYPWLQPPSPDSFTGPYEAIARTHEPSHFLADAAGVEVLRVVHVDAGHDPADPVAETRWLQDLAARPPGLPQGIVAAADLAAPDVAATLAAHAAFANVRGIRQILNVHDDPRKDYVGRHYMREAGWRAGFALLARHGLSFDLQIYPSQMAEAAALAAAHPDTQVILNHTGMCIDRTLAGWRQWRDGLRALAAVPNVAVKISGLGMIDHRWTIESLRPYVLETIDAFGAARCMFASNFPVDRLYASYADTWGAYGAIIADASADEQAALLRDNADRLYRLR
jgi:predicted TIM-barrel fold metal-dependent hydrolase